MSHHIRLCPSLCCRFPGGGASLGSLLNGSQPGRPSTWQQHHAQRRLDSFSPTLRCEMAPLLFAASTSAAALPGCYGIHHTPTTRCIRCMRQYRGLRSLARGFDSARRRLARRGGHAANFPTVCISGCWYHRCLAGFFTDCLRERFVDCYLMRCSCIQAALRHCQPMPAASRLARPRPGVSRDPVLGRRTEATRSCS